MAYADEVAARIWSAFLDKQTAERKRNRTYTQADLGAAVAKAIELPNPIPQPNVSRWMKGTELRPPKIPRARTLAAIADELGVSFDWIVRGTSPPGPPPQIEPELMTPISSEAIRRAKAKRRGRAS